MPQGALNSQNLQSKMFKVQGAAKAVIEYNSDGVLGRDWVEMGIEREALD